MTSEAAASARSLGAPKAFRRWLVALILLCLVVTGYFDRISVAVLFSNSDFQTAMGIGFNPALLGMLMTAFFIPYGIASLFLSFTGDAFGPRRMLVGGTLIWGTLMLIMGSVSSYAAMLVSRVLLGIAEGPQFAWILKIISRWFPRTEHGRANTIWLAGKSSRLGHRFSVDHRSRRRVRLASGVLHACGHEHRPNGSAAASGCEGLAAELVPLKWRSRNLREPAISGKTAACS